MGWLVFASFLELAVGVSILRFGNLPGRIISWLPVVCAILEIVFENDRHIAGRVRAAGDTDIDLTQRDLVGNYGGRFQTRAAGALEVEPRGL